ncbi:MAG TPA: MFS transporter [Bacteroidales bacterium]|nr:MFS transporter [Bacteroidales bacterium]
MQNKKTIFISSCAGMLLFGICMISLGSMAPALREKFILDDLASGAMFSVLPFGILAGSLIFGPVVDRRGYKLLLFLSCIILGAGFEGIALASSSAFLKLFIFMIGLGGGAINGATNSLVSDISERGKGANLSLLGVCFGIGALGMPLILGIVEKRFSFESIISVIALFSILTGIIYLIIKLPEPKQTHGISIKTLLSFFRDRILVLIALFLFFQSSFEGIMNNWTTSYMIDNNGVTANIALFTLSLFVAGMTIMRLLAGTAFRNIGIRKIITVSFVLILVSIVLIKSSVSTMLVMTGFMITGFGLAYGFPTMLGFVGERYKELSGTAFSFVISIGLIGNMSLNYSMGLIAQKSGISSMIPVILGLSFFLIILFYIIIKLLRT